MMRTFLIATGNTLRRDDGIAHHVLDLVRPTPGTRTRALLQLTPELAHDIAGCDAVIFIDADAGASVPSIEPLDQSPAPPAVTHISTPAEIVWLSRALFGFAGQAFLCRIPAEDLSCGEGLSRRTTMLAAEAARELEVLLRSFPNCEMTLSTRSSAPDKMPHG
jgi:Ni,Fe-hydrogenase maturation factor